MLLRGASAAAAAPWERAFRPAPAPSGSPVVATARQVTSPAPPPAPPAPAPAVVAAPEAAHADGEYYTGPERRAGERRLRSANRLGDVYAEQLEQLRELARRDGWAIGHAEGITAAADVVAAAERAAEVRLAEAQARWERRLATATAALGSAAAQLEAAAAPVAEELRESVLDAVLTLVGDVLGRELLLATAPGLDALRRALTLCPDDVPVVVRLHPDDLAEVPRAELHALPASVSVVGDPEVERAGAIATAGATRVDAQLTAALARVRAVLRG
ncbi:FliH/SctL family protein [Modestobacter sp. URMC 112]